MTLSSEEVDLLRAAPNLACPTGLRDRCIIEVMLRCGLRISEACGLHLRDIDWRTGEVRLRPENAKGQREAVVYLDEPTQALLERWKDVRRTYGAGRQHLFVSVRTGQRGKGVTTDSIYKMVVRRAKKAGIERPIHPHMLRHTFATQLLTDGFNLLEVQKLMRHSNVQTTTIYLHLRDVELQAKIRRRPA